MQKPHIVTTPPGPQARAWIQRDDQVISPSLPREYPLVITHGDGVWVTDPDQNVYLDFTSGIAVCSTGHCHPAVVGAIEQQIHRLIHTCAADFFHQPLVELAEKLVAITPGDHPKRIYFGNSGAEAVEAGFKLSRWHSRREKVIAFLGAFHGRTMGALTLTASKSVQKKWFSPLVPEVYHVPYGHCYRCAYHLTYPSCDLACVSYIENIIFRSILSPEEVAAIVVEPIQGEGGYVVPPPDFHQRLKALAEKYGILYVVDEIQTGFGRTGRMFAMEHFGVTADMMALAKGIASGMPLSALVARAEVMNWSRGAHGSTYGGNPVSCAAALATIQQIEAGLIANARQRGDQLRSGLLTLQQRFECIGDVRGLGLMQAAELVADRQSKATDKPLRDLLLQRCFEKGLLLLSCGESTIRFCPPLIVSEEQVNCALEIFERVLADILAGSGV